MPLENGLQYNVLDRCNRTGAQDSGRRTLIQTQYKKCSLREYRYELKHAQSTSLKGRD